MIDGVGRTIIECKLCEKCCCIWPGIYTALGFQQPLLPTSLAPCLTCTLSSQPFLHTDSLIPQHVLDVGCDNISDWFIIRKIRTVEVAKFPERDQAKPHGKSNLVLRSSGLAQFLPAESYTCVLGALTPRHFTPTSHPTIPYLLTPAPTSCTLHPTTLHSDLPSTPSTRRAKEFCSIVFPTYFSQSTLARLTPNW